MNEQRQLERLLEIDDGKWKTIMDTLYGFVRYKVCNWESGAFSVKNLPEPAEKYFVHEAIKKLWECVREWREDLTIEEQLRQIIGSMMSEEVRKFRQRGGVDNVTLNENIKVEATKKRVEQSDFYEWLELEADGDDELERYVRAFKVCWTSQEIAIEMGIDVSKVYNITKRLKRKLENDKVLWMQ